MKIDVTIMWKNVTMCGNVGVNYKGVTNVENLKFYNCGDFKTFTYVAFMTQLGEIKDPFPSHYKVKIGIACLQGLHHAPIFEYQMSFSVLLVFIPNM